MSDRLVIVRHGATAWSVAGKHTGRSDQPLTDAGRRDAEALRPALQAWQFARVLASPLQRARETCRLAGYGDVAESRDALMEWDYGSYEGRTTADIRRERPDWLLWRDGAPGGETAAAVGARVDPVIDEVRATSGDVLVFAHGHLLRVLAARWVGLEPADGSRLALDTGTISVLGWEREVAVIASWNAAVARREG